MLRILAVACACLAASCSVAVGSKLDKADDHAEVTMFAAATKGHAKGKLFDVLGIRRLKQICAQLEESNSFRCTRVWGTGASGTLLNDNEEAWLPEEISRIVKSLKIPGAQGIRWRASSDEPLTDIKGKRKESSLDGRKHSWFGQESELPLFNSRRFGGEKRGLIAADSVAPASKVTGQSTITQHEAPLPLGSLSAYAGGCSSPCNSPKKYFYSTAGKDVTIYIVDGNVVDHEQFQDMETGSSRVSERRHFSASAKQNEGQSCAADHGTHVASLAAGFELGAGKAATIVSVAVQPGCGESGYVSELEEGLDWVLEQHLAQPEPRKPGVVSMSLIISKESSTAILIEEKVQELLENGLIVVAAAGNYHEDSCDFVPSGLQGVITVAAADITEDAKHAYPWSWSNFGKCVDIWAPGVDIDGASPICHECFAQYSGTSQATPLVSGIIAEYLSVNPQADAEDVLTALKKHASPHVLDMAGFASTYATTTNRFAQTTAST